MVQHIIDNFPAELQAVDSTNFQLKICLEPCAIAFLLQATDSTLQAAEYFAWTPKDNEEPAKIIAFLKQKSKLFNLNQFKTTVYFRTENVMFLPNELIASARLLLQVQFGFQFGEGCLQKNINADMVVAWKIDSVWAELFTEQFPGHTCQSSLGNLYASIIPNGSNIIYLAFGNGLVEMVVIFKQDLKLAKCFAYETIDDLHYHLLNICKQLKVEPSEVQLKIQGFVEKSATLYRSLQTFFVDVQTINADDSNWPEALKTLPAHYFTGLIQSK
jgi:hypothetical protein